MLKEQIAELVETTLARTRPGKAFTVAVLAALPAPAPGTVAAAVATVAGAAQGSVAAKAGAASLAGAVVGPLLGEAGAWVGAKASIESTRSPRERQFMVSMTWISLALSLAFLVVELLGLIFLPHFFATLTLQLGIAGLYAGLLTQFIVRINRRQRQIQVEEGTFVDPRAIPPADLAGMSRGAIYGSIAGGIFGSLCWMPIMAMVVGDYALGLAVIISMAETAAVMAVTFGVVNWRWEAWMVAYRRTRVYEPMSDLPLWAMNVLLVALFLHFGPHGSS